MTLYGGCKATYQLLVPERFRDSLYRATPGRLNRARAWFIRQLERTARHDEIYDATYYAKYIEPEMARSVEVIADSIVSAMSPSTAVDIGCGTGGLLQALRQRGVQCTGFEYSVAAIDVCRERALDVHRFDIEHDPFPGTRADVVVSTEVAEHLPERCARKYVELLTRTSNTCVITAAIPGQGGTDHVNEQPNEYWIERFEDRDYRYDREVTFRWRREWPERHVSSHFAGNVMVFRNDQSSVCFT